MSASGERVRGGGVRKGGQVAKRRKGRRNEPNYHDFPFVEIVLIDKSFAKMAIRLGALEGLQEYGGVRTGRKPRNRMLG
jgi:hypothetical protein